MRKQIAALCSDKDFLIAGTKKFTEPVLASMLHWRCGLGGWRIDVSNDATSLLGWPLMAGSFKTCRLINMCADTGS